ncbi:MAG: hypothetical protein JWP91_3327 [Fibrobacteres bacterium]|nr:hypothetical protein [Fibrobacterota bacterium]
MKKPDRKPLSAPHALNALLILIAAAFLYGCLGAKDQTRVAGGDDIPNDVEPLGKKSAQARDDSADWNGYKSMPRSGPGMYDTTSVPDGMPDTSGSGGAQPKPSSLGGSAAGRPGYASGPVPSAEEGIPPLPDPLKPLDTLVTKVVDTAKGVVEAVHTRVKDAVVTVDSTLFVPADSASPGSTGGVLQVAGRITYGDTGIWKAYRFRDADGDGFLAPRPGSRNLADLDAAEKTAEGKVRRSVRRVAAGKDLDFNARGDNQVLSSLVAVTLAADTLDVFRLLDADGDSLVLDFTKDTNLVDLVEEHRYPSGGAIASMTQRARLVVFSRDSAKNYAVRFERRTINRDGSVLEVATRGAGADSSFHAGMDAVWTETLTLPAGDGLASHARAFRVRLAPAPGAFKGNTLSGLAVTEIHHNESFDRFTFDFQSEAPVADGKWIGAGAVKAMLSYRQGATLTFEGQAIANGMEGSVASSAGTSISLFFDRNGAATRRP